MKPVTAKLGRTTYEAFPQAVNIVRLVRTNADGAETMFVPTALLIAYVAELKRSQSVAQTDEQLLGLKP